MKINKRAEQKYCIDKVRGIFRWHNKKKCWFAKQNEQTMAIAKELCGESVATAAAVKKVTTATKVETTAKIVKGVMNERCCYAAPVSEFLHENESDFIKKMKSAFSDEYVLSLGQEQIHAWKDCFSVMQDMVMNPDDGIIFEYV